MMKVRIGDLRSRVELQQQSLAQNSLAEDVPTFTTKATVWASIEPLSGRERYNAQQLNADVTHKITVRYYANLNATWQIKLGTRIFDIAAVLNIEERNAFMEITAREVLPPTS